MSNYRLLDLVDDRLHSYKPPKENPLAFAKDIAFIPIAGIEIMAFAGWYPLVFKKQANGYQFGMPVRSEEFGNILVHPEKGRWLGNKIPHILKRYPYAVTESSVNENGFDLCIADPCAEFRLYDLAEGETGRYPINEYGEPSQFGLQLKKQLITFVKSIQKVEKMTECLDDYGLLKPWQPDWSSIAPNAEKPIALNVEDLYQIKLGALRNLEDDQVLSLHRHDGFKLVYAHWMSLLRIPSVVFFNNKMRSFFRQPNLQDMAGFFNSQQNDSFDFDAL